MADFKTHITVSSALGVAYGAVAWKHFDMPAPSCVLAGVMCGVSGMLPDLDSDSGVPLREGLAFAAASVPMLLIERLRNLGWPHETMVLVGAGVYFAIRFGVGKLLKKYTVHRGMFHSLPAAAIAGLIAFSLASGSTLNIRGYKAMAVVAGFMSHLILDEIWSVRVRGGIGLKSSFGTAMKFWGGSTWDNLTCYLMLTVMSLIVMSDPIWANVSPRANELHQIAETFVDRAQTIVDGVEQRANLPLPSGTLPWLNAASPTPAATGYSPPNYSPQPPYAQPTYSPPQQYAPPPNYGMPQPYVQPPPYTPPQPYAPQPQPYYQPYVQPQQAQSPGYVPYVSPRY